jgi:hypothetical protein
MMQHAILLLKRVPIPTNGINLHCEMTLHCESMLAVYNSFYGLSGKVCCLLPGLVAPARE